jgi:hypothetical protein
VYELATNATTRVVAATCTRYLVPVFVPWIRSSSCSQKNTVGLLVNATTFRRLVVIASVFVSFRISGTQKQQDLLLGHHQSRQTFAKIRHTSCLTITSQHLVGVDGSYWHFKCRTSSTASGYYQHSLVHVASTDKLSSTV